MSNAERLTPPSNYAAQLEAHLSALQDHARLEGIHRDAQLRTWSNLNDLIRKYGVTEETKFIVAAFSGSPGDPNKTRERLDKLQMLEEEVRSAAGQSVAWITTVRETTSYRDPGPNRTEQRYYLHIGLLPIDARLQVDERGQLTIPIEKSVCLPINKIYQNDGHPSFDHQVIPTGVYSETARTPELEARPGVNVSLWNQEIPYPLLVGDDVVAEMFDKNKLEERRQVTVALEVLTSTLF